MAKVKEGNAAPVFDLPSSAGKKVSLAEFKGKKKVVLYFYPKDDTPGCTVEACGFRDNNKAFEREDAVVLGVSPDGEKAHQKFIGKFNLPFVLLSDEDKKVCKAYGVWVKKTLYGKEYMGVARTTFIIGESGKVVKIFEKVKPDGHSEEVLDTLKMSWGREG